MVWPFPDKRERLRRQAARWVARLQGDPAGGDLARFRRWHDADPAHAEAFARLSARYDLSAILRQSARVRSSLAHRPQLWPSRPVGLAIASAACALLVMTAALRLGGQPAVPADAGILILSTQVGEIRALDLADGTRVTLDTGTTLRVEMQGDRRRVTLSKGRARFEVAAQDPRPFVVEAGASRIVGSGTFDVRLADGGTRVQAHRGSLAIEPADPRSTAAPAALARGQAIIVGADGGRRALPASESFEAYWPTGRLEFDATPLGQALAEANRYSRTQIRLADPALSRLRLTGVFRAGDAAGLARGAAAALDLRLERASAELWVLHPKP